MGGVALPSNVALSDALMVVFRSDGVIVYASDAYCRVIGKERHGDPRQLPTMPDP